MPFLGVFVSFAVSIVLPLFAIITVVLRFVARRKKSLKWQKDDYTVLAALVIAIVQGVLTALGCYKVGMEGGFSDSSQFILDHLSWILLAHQVLWFLAVVVVKISILFFYKRIFAIPLFQRVANIMIGIVICWLIVFIIACVTTFTHGFQINQLLRSSAGSDIALDIVTLLLPIPMIAKLHISVRRKCQLFGIFGLGLLCVVASITRLVYVVRFIDAETGETLPIDTLVWIIMWSQVEPCTSIIAACLPTLGGLIKNKKKIRSETAKVGTYPSDRAGQPTGSDSHKHQRRPPSVQGFSPITCRSDNGSSSTGKYSWRASLLGAMRASAEDVEMQKFFDGMIRLENESGANYKDH